MLERNFPQRLLAKKRTEFEADFTFPVCQFISSWYTRLLVWHIFILLLSIYINTKSLSLSLSHTHTHRHTFSQSINQLNSHPCVCVCVYKHIHYSQTSSKHTNTFFVWISEIKIDHFYSFEYSDYCLFLHNVYIYIYIYISATEYVGTFYHEEYSDYCFHLHYYIHNVSADMSFGLLQFFPVDFVTHSFNR